MNDYPPKQATSWLGAMGWLPVVAYFVLKYLIIGAENMTIGQNLLLLGAAVLAILAVRQYQKRSQSRKNEDDHGTHP